MNERFKERRLRLAQLEKELALLKKQRKALERDFQREDPEEWVESRRGPAKPPAQPPSSGGDPIPGGGRGEAGDILPPKEEEDRERFAHYFMTGSLGRHAPQLRHERRAMRNKAIVMAILAFVLLFALIRFLIK